MSNKYVSPEKILEYVLKALDRKARAAQRPIPAPAIPCGQVSMFAGVAAPTGYLICRGQAVSRTAYSKLFALIGTMYGAGNGTSTFNVPDLRGRVPVGVSSETEFNAPGKTSGAKTVALTAAQIPELTGTAASAGGHTHPRPPGQLILGGIDTSTLGRGPVGGSGFQGFRATDINDLVYPNPVTGSSGTHTHSVTVASGTTAAHNNLQPSMAINFIIKI